MGKLTTAFVIAVLAIVTATQSDIVAKINSEQTYWTAEHNPITQQGMAYMKNLLGTILPDNPKTIKREQLNSYKDVPDEFDARYEWPYCPSIASIKDQGHCGSCWAVAATSTASDRLCISNPEIPLNLSAENVNSCCHFCSLFGGCNGGYSLNAWFYMKIFGVVTGGDYDSDEGCQPYEISPAKSSDNSSSCEFIFTPFCHFHCTNKKYSTSYYRDIHRVSKVYTVDTTVQAIQSEIMNNGPVHASLKVYDDFMSYKSGVYVQTSSNYLGAHSVRILGWGTDPTSGLNYWLVANSWNKTWGDDGLFKIRRGTDECNIEDFVIAGTF